MTDERKPDDRSDDPRVTRSGEVRHGATYLLLIFGGILVLVVLAAILTR